ncbi:hypothetical protein AM493_18615 [Flavobacterium akiainvivens]|uniref:Uncharacterized protein n=1 Tax=Flavobacterium akiainvivens TaxID=1202724 RepID=A0A0M8MFJ1_9FLAO|nr:hypothetical protein [Flavobacterium akiainvivens]KOS07844.1 hypothetical protein AM493_18615 [Flavobacterium akiainvivens]
MTNPERKTKIKAFLISLIYVGLGTLAVMCTYPPYYGNWVLILAIVTLPVSIFGFSVMLAGKYYIYSLLIQVIVFFIFNRVVYRFLSKNMRKTKGTI